MFVIVYCELKSAVAAVLVTRAVPLPVSVPVPLTIIAAAGDRTAFALMVRVPFAAKFVAAETAAPVFEIVMLLKVVAVEPPMACAAVPLNATVLVFAVNVPALLVKLPLTERLPPALNVNVLFVIVRLPVTARLPVEMVVLMSLFAADPGR